MSITQVLQYITNEHVQYNREKLIAAYKDLISPIPRII